MIVAVVIVVVDATDVVAVVLVLKCFILCPPAKSIFPFLQKKGFLSSDMKYQG